jgi:hypothetical protein
MAAMQVLAPRVPKAPLRASIVSGTVVGATLLFGGVVVAWLAFGTTFITSFTPVGRPEASQMLAGMLAWTFALIAPATFIIVGLARIVAVFDLVTSQRRKRGAVSRLAAVLGDEYVVATRLRLPDGQVIPEIVLGPFGAAILEPLPPLRATRRHGTAWEVRRSDGRWMPLENPLDRAARDAERVRRWLAHDDADFLVKTYAAVIAPDTSLARTPNCAVITNDQIAAWLASLPAQRGLTETRRTQVVEQVREQI